MKHYWLILLLLLPGYFTRAQQAVPLPHGMIFGTRPDTANALNISKLHGFMGKKTRITTVLKGKIANVTHQQGGWFNVNSGNKQLISAHFKNYGVILPVDIAGRVVIMQCVAKKNIRSDDHQVFAGDTATHTSNEKATGTISLEVIGLMIYQ
ncbi:MAG: DUF4920 domain-containing protein [Sphingobacteriaceae bacterium]|nr:MAG: DUF4920 domain-containing protein [Sphingobacteriaceae bacterium]